MSYSYFVNLWPPAVRPGNYVITMYPAVSLDIFLPGPHVRIYLQCHNTILTHTQVRAYPGATHTTRLHQQHNGREKMIQISLCVSPLYIYMYTCIYKACTNTFPLQEYRYQRTVKSVRISMRSYR